MKINTFLNKYKYFSEILDKKNIGYINWIRRKQN